MTWSPFFSVVTPGPTSATIPAPSWPRIAGKMPSGSAPERVYSSVWQMPVALISIITSPARGPSTSTVSRLSGLPASRATAARTCIATPPLWRRLLVLLSVRPELSEVGDHVLPLLLVLQSGKDHLRVRHDRLRRRQGFVQLFRCPAHP